MRYVCGTLGLLMALTLSGCRLSLLHTDFDEGPSSAVQAPNVTILFPAQGSYIPASVASTFTLHGTCAPDGRVVAITG